jgi:signal transduction histidine kinase
MNEGQQSENLEKPTGRILIVDDDETNRLILRTILEEKGHIVHEASDGEDALKQVEIDPPDVILLDVIMPGMNGYEVCRILKRQATTSPIPVLMITSLTERNDMLEGIEAGASDFLSKPVWAPEIAMRVRNALFSKRLYDRTREDFERLKELEHLRDELTHMIVHDLRSPLMAITFGLDVHKHHAASKLTEAEMEPIKEVTLSAKRLVEMVNSLLDVSRLESGKMPLQLEECDLVELSSEVIKSIRSLNQDCEFEVTQQARVMIQCDRELIRRVLTNIGTNAVKFVTENGKIKFHIQDDNGEVKVFISDNGAGIPAEYHAKIFEKFGQAGARKQGRMYSTGLGLTFCKLAVEAHGGEIGVESEVGKGSTFWFTLPKNS